MPAGTGDSEDLRAILNSGFQSNGQVHKCVGEGANLRYASFSSFCPKALAGIGSLPWTLADRSLSIVLQRKMPGDVAERLRRRCVEGEAGDLQARMEAWAAACGDALATSEPDLPEELDDRGQDMVEPLLAIADAAGAGWPARARRSLVAVRNGRLVSGSRRRRRRGRDDGDACDAYPRGGRRHLARPAGGRKATRSGRPHRKRHKGRTRHIPVHACRGGRLSRRRGDACKRHALPSRAQEQFRHVPRLLRTAWRDRSVTPAAAAPRRPAAPRRASAFHVRPG